MYTSKIETTMWRKPIPDRNHDWEAALQSLREHADRARTIIDQATK